MSGPMVRAVLDGSKTQTRRVMKPQPTGSPLRYKDFSWFEGGSMPDVASACPYGLPGDQLWVKETFAEIPENGGTIVYRSTDPEWETECGTKWTPSIFMPRKASRLTLEILSVRVERVQDISEADAEAEGIQFIREHPDADETLTARQLFEALWDSINAKKSPWSANEWVWVISFKRVEQEEAR